MDLQYLNSIISCVLFQLFEHFFPSFLRSFPIPLFFSKGQTLFLLFQTLLHLTRRVFLKLICLRKPVSLGSAPAPPPGYQFALQACCCSSTQSHGPVSSASHGKGQPQEWTISSTFSMKAHIGPVHMLAVDAQLFLM